MIYKVKLNDTEKIKEMVRYLTNVEYSADLSSGRYVVDAKSLLGIFSLNLSVPVTLTIHADKETCADFVNWLNERDMIVSPIFV